MRKMRNAADYREKTATTEFIGNPLIASLPDSLPQEDLLNVLLKMPPIREEDRKSLPQDRLDCLSRINTIHIPFVHDLFIARSISRCINWGYISRNPMPFSTTAQVMQKYRQSVTPELENYLTRSVFPIYGFSVLGVSGVGKSCSVLNALMRYSRVIDHTEYNGVPFHCAQLVWLKVDCPGDASPKSLCSAILQQIDASLGTSYRSEFSNRISRDVMITKVSQILSSHHLGILVIDDIQNLCGVKQVTSTDLLSFLIYLMETMAIPVVMIGTPKVLPLFQQEFQLAKRATGEGTVRIELLPKDSKEWKRFIEVLWLYQLTEKKVPLTEEMEKVFYDESVGNPFLCSLLYKLVQDDAITCGHESFTVQDVHHVADDKLCITARMRTNMLHGTDEELKKYENLWKAVSFNIDTPVIITTPQSKTSKEDEAIAYISQALIKKYGIGLKQATQLAKDAVLAKGTNDKEETLGFAAQLYEKILESKKEKKETDSGPTAGEDSNTQNE